MPSAGAAGLSFGCGPESLRYVRSMIDTTQHQHEERQADFTLPEGCVACGGKLQVRLTPGSAYAYCESCRMLSKPFVQVSREGFRIAPVVQHFA